MSLSWRSQGKQPGQGRDISARSWPISFLRAFEYSQAAQKYAADQPRVELAWHIVNMFDIPPGSVMIPAGDPYAGGEAGWEYTQETIVTDPKNLTHYFRPFTTLNIQKFDLKSADLDARDKKVWELSTTTTYTDVKQGPFTRSTMIMRGLVPRMIAFGRCCEALGLLDCGDGP